jgi:hypothetical protein
MERQIKALNERIDRKQVTIKVLRILASSIFGATLAWLITTVHGFILIPVAVGKIMGEIYNKNDDERKSES